MSNLFSHGNGLQTQKNYKTEICKNWVLGTCEFSEQCLFAHGITELRQKLLPAKYKTRLCLNQEQEGFCRYGRRCQFRHREDNQNTAPGTPLHLSVNKRTCEASRKRLPIFLELESRANTK